MMTLHDRQDIPVKLIGSWTTSVGPIQDQAGNVLIIQSYNVFKLKSHRCYKYNYFFLFM